MEYKPDKEFEKKLSDALNKMREEQRTDWEEAEYWTEEELQKQIQAERNFIDEFVKHNAPAGYKRFSFDED